MENREFCRGAWFAVLKGGKAKDVESYIKGQKQPPDSVRNLQGSPDTFSFNGGSGNWPWVAAATYGDLDWMMESLEVERQRGLGRCEIGAEVYPERIPAKMWGLRLAREGHPAPAGFVELMRSNLAAEIAAVAIASRRTPVRRLTQRIFKDQPDGGESTVDGNDRYYDGWSSALPVQRTNFAVFLDGLLAPLAAWACAEPTLRLKRKFVEHWWPIAAAERVVGAKFGQPTPPEVWGLTTEQRDACRAWVNGDVQALPTLLAMLSGWSPMALISIYRTDQGTAAWMGGTGEAEAGCALHTFKPSILFRRIDSDGAAALAMPARFNKAGNASKGSSYLDPADGTVVTEADDTSFHNPLPAGELELWLRWGPGGILEAKTAGGVVTPEPTEPDPPEEPTETTEPGSPRPAAAVAADLRRLAGELAPAPPAAPRPRGAVARDLLALARELDPAVT